MRHLIHPIQIAPPLIAPPLMGFSLFDRFDDGNYDADPEWTVQSGTWSAAGGRLIKTASASTHEYLSTPSTFVVGTWEFKFRFDAVNSTKNIAFYIMNNEATRSATSDGYLSDHDWSGNNNLAKFINGTYTVLIGFSAARDTNDHTVKITRDADGNFEYFFDGVSRGTATDTDVTTSNFMLINSMGTNDEYDNIKAW